MRHEPSLRTWNFFFFCFQVVKLLSWSCCYYGCCKWPFGPFSFFICVLLKYQSDTARHGHEQQLSTAPRKMIFLSFSTCWWPAPWIFPGEHLRPSWSAGNKKQKLFHPHRFRMNVQSMKLPSSSEFQQGYARNERKREKIEWVFSYAIPVLSFRIDCKGQLDPMAANVTSLATRKHTNQ